MCGHHYHDESDVNSDVKAMLERRHLVQALAAGGALSVAGTSLSGCSTNPETGASQLLLIGSSQLNRMAAASWADAKSTQPVSRDPRYNSRLQTIGDRVSRGANKHNEQWEYAVFDEDTRNAFVLPGNRVGFYKGMMDFADNDDQIAAVMGHEVGHVTGRHAQERVSQQMAGQIGLTTAAVLANGRLNPATSSLVNAALGVGYQVGVVLPFSRKHESQSDLLGARYMHNAGYDPYQSVRLWEKMAAEAPSRQPEILSTHPDPARRARDLHNYIKYQETLGSQGWQSIQLPRSS